MQVRFYANMRAITGKTSIEINDADLDSLRKLVAFLIDKFPDTTFHLLDEHGNLRPDVPVFVDGRNPRLLENGIDAPLQQSAIVSFFSPISSGRLNVEVLRKSNYGKQGQIR